MNPNEFKKEAGKPRHPFAWLYVGLVLSMVGMLTGAVMLIWQIAKLFFK